MRTLVISGINLFEGGALSIYHDCLYEILREKINERFNIIAFVHKKELFKQYGRLIKIIELPKSRESYINRLWYEYFYFYRFSLRTDVDIWISLHDITPRVKTRKLYTYCHNPSPFMKRDLSKIKYSPTNVAFSFLYKYLYRINIKANTAVIVQQDWMRKKFNEMYPVKEIIVAHPAVSLKFARENSARENTARENTDRENTDRRMAGKKVFIYASYPRFFKNFEVICEAVKLLDRDDFEVWFTLDGKENSYAEDLYKRYGKLNQIKWLGILSREEIFKKYTESDCMIFSSLLETWGLPISEYKMLNKPIFLSNLPYAHETLGDYSKSRFFDPYHAGDLADGMKRFLDGRECMHAHSSVHIDTPYVCGWEELLQLIVSR